MARLSIESSRRRTNRATEGRALLVLAGATAQQPASDALVEAQKLYLQADLLMAQTGASLFEQPMLRERKRLLAMKV